MPGARITSEQLDGILRKKGYGLGAQPIKSTFSGPSIVSEVSGAGSIDDLESDIGDESLGAKKLQIGYSGKVRIRITFYRRRLADYGEECSRAISEKALIDCCVYAGLIQGDSSSEVWVEDGGQKKVGSNEEERTEIELFYEGVDLDNLWVKAKQNNAR